MSSVLVAHATVVTMDAERRVLPDAAVGVRDGEIVAVGDTAQVRAGEDWDEILDAAGGAVMPGFVNSHTHGCMLFQRTLGYDQTFESWFPRTQLPMMRAMSLEDYALAERLTMVENLLEGNTTVLENSFFRAAARAEGSPEEATVEAAREAGVRLVLGTSYMTAHADEDFVEPIDEVQTRLADALARWHRTDRLIVTPSLLLPWATEPEDLHTVLALARDAGAMLHFHTAETPGYNERCRELHGARSNVDFLHRNDALGPDVQLVGCSEIDDADLDLIADSGSHVISVPTSNLFQSHAPLRVPELFARGVPVSYGSNGCAGNGRQGMFDAVKDGAGVVKSLYGDPTIVDKDRALAMATITAAESLGIDDLVGSIEPGKRGDLIVVDVARPHYAPALNIIAALAYSARGSDVTHVLVDGEVVVRQGRCTRLDPTPLVGEVTKRARALAEASPELRPRLCPSAP